LPSTPARIPQRISEPFRRQFPVDFGVRYPGLGSAGEWRLIDLSSFLGRGPELPIEVLKRIELFRREIELEVHQAVQRVQEPKESLSGDGTGARLSRAAQRKIEGLVIERCAKLYILAAEAYAESPPIDADLTGLFEELAGAIFESA